MTAVALGAVLIIICSWLTVPFAVPFTMQTFAVYCALLLLGGRRGLLAVLLYILLGAFGLPVFSGFRGGIGALLGPTGGYILGFLLCALLFRLL
jgi:biotin transport system substrate-specific component